MIRKKSCGSCQCYMKMNNHVIKGYCHSSGGTAKSDGHKCPDWKGIKYDRNKYKKVNK